MRIVIDLQGAQTESRFRGIGRYSLSLAQAIVRNRGDHEIFIALNGFFSDTIESIRLTFNEILPQENIRVWHTPCPVMEGSYEGYNFRESAELMREDFLAKLSPDIIHVSSLFEGYIDNAVTSICRFDKNTPISVSLYDLIPLMNPDHYFKRNPGYAEHYQRKLENLKHAKIFLAISEHTLHEGMRHLNIPKDRIVNISTAKDPCFQQIQAKNRDLSLLKKFNLTRPFILYTGGVDERKNLPRLIQAFAALDPSLRNSHQLLVAGKITEKDLLQLHYTCKKAGLKTKDLCFAGYVTDQELIMLYNQCKLFVFPSWHEGFGLPVLEAMACGAPVICSNTSSLPEVVGFDAAMFNPFSVESICKKISQGLQDDNFREVLINHGLKQAKQFSWDKCAESAIKAWEAYSGNQKIINKYVTELPSTDGLVKAIASQIPASAEGDLKKIAICLAQNCNTAIERQLLIDVSELSNNDAATGVQRVVRSYLKALLLNPPKGFRIEPVYATLEKSYRYARRFTKQFLGHDNKQEADKCVRWQRGDVFFGLDMQHHVQLRHSEFYKQIRADGVIVKFLVYDLLPIQLEEIFFEKNFRQLHEQWLALLAKNDGVICISKATADAYDRWLKENSIKCAPNFCIDWVHIGADIGASKPSKGMPIDSSFVLNNIRSRPSFLCVATVEPRKGQEQILEAIERLWEEERDVNLVLVGKLGWQMDSLSKRLRNHPEFCKRLYWLQGVSDEYLDSIYNNCSCLVAASINEGFGLPIIEAAQHKLPIIARDISVFREVAKDSALYFLGESPAELADALKDWLELYKTDMHPKSDHLKWQTWKESTNKLKQALINNYYPRKQLLVDISELVKKDVGTGIQRVVRNILREWLSNPPNGYRVEPVYATIEKSYCYAQKFLKRFFGNSHHKISDEVVEYAPGDTYIGLDLQPQVVFAQRKFFQRLRQHGVTVKFVVYDLLSVLMPQFFVNGTEKAFRRWLEVVTENDGALCISKSVADELTMFITQNSQEPSRPFQIDWFHLGADFRDEKPVKPLCNIPYLKRLSSTISFLMVGTLEPRKGHKQVLDAFNLLWQSGKKVNLVIVGKEGWMANDFVLELRSHSEFDKQLFWLKGISDEYLKLVYSSCNCLIAASYGEGFGLPLIEAAQHNLNIIARDIPVFREVAGEKAFYFNVKVPNELAQAIQTWINLYEKEKHPVSTDMPWLTWEESARNLISKIILGK